MNATPASEGRPQPDAPGACGAHTSMVAESGTVPRQKGGGQEAERLRGASTDLLEHPDPHIAAQAAAVENLLRCWVRENNLPAPDQGILRVPLKASGTALLVPVHYWSATGWHRFSLPYLEDGPPSAPPVDAVTVAALLGRETARRATAHADADGTAGTATSPEPAGAAAGAASRANAANVAGTSDAADPTTTSEPVDGADLVGRVAATGRRTAPIIPDPRGPPPH
ncbi:iron transporter, partial [Streptomyces venezuelae]